MGTSGISRPIRSTISASGTTISGGGAKAEAERLSVPFLGEVPLEIEIRETSDAGLPIVATKPDSAHAKIYREIAARVRDQMAGSGKGRAAPRIVIES